ncbi:hypothetical protein SLA2020_450540 [Shorea laevis]
MSIQSVISIGKGLGTILDVEDSFALGAIFRSYLRILIEIDVRQPLKLGFLFCREGGSSIWVSLKYERLEEYYALCGLIGQTKFGCKSSQDVIFSERYKISLKVIGFSNLLPHPSDVPLKPSYGVSSPITSHNNPIHGGGSTPFPHACILPATSFAILVSQKNPFHQTLSSCDAKPTMSSTPVKPSLSSSDLLPSLIETYKISSLLP